MDKLPTPTRVAHNLGLAACLGGTLFGKVAFNPSLSLIGSKPERGKVGGTTWNRFNALNAASFVLAAATWLPQSFGLTGERRQHLRVVRNLGLAKDVLMGVAGSVGLSVLVLQIVLYRQAPKGAVPLETGGVPAAEASDRASWLQRAVSVLGSVHIALFAGIVALTAMLCWVEACQPANPSLLPAGTLIRRTRIRSGFFEAPDLLLALVHQTSEKANPRNFGCRDSKKFGIIEPGPRPTRRSYPCPGRTSGGPTIEAMTAPDIIIPAVA